MLPCGQIYSALQYSTRWCTDIKNSQRIIFSEWSAVNGNLLKRRDFIYGDLVDRASYREMPLFSDLDEEAYIPEPIKDYPLIHFLEVGNVE